MGDMNDDPTNKSMKDVLSAKADVKDVKDGDMYNPWYNILTKQGVGTLSYQARGICLTRLFLRQTCLTATVKRLLYAEVLEESDIPPRLSVQYRRKI